MKVLIVRTIQFDLLVKLIEAVHMEYPDCHISILTNPQQRDRVRRLESLESVFVTRHRRDLSLTNIGLSNIVGIRRSAFDLVVIPHKQSGMGGFGNILFLLPFLGIAKWLHCRPDWKLHEIDKRSLVYLTLKSALAALFFFPLVIVSLIGFLSAFWFGKKSPDHSNSDKWYAGFGDI
ncbi:MAG: hypothetical protein ACE5G1_08600 [bacterium]